MPLHSDNLAKPDGTKPGEDFGRRAARWTMDHVITIAAVFIAIGSLINMVNNLDKRVTVLENDTKNASQTISEVRGDVKVLLSKVQDLKDDQRHVP